MLTHDLYSVVVEALPLDIPSTITVDVSVLREVEMAIYARDLILPQGVTLVTDPNATVARVVLHRVAVEAEEAAPVEEAAAAEAGAPEAEESTG